MFETCSNAGIAGATVFARGGVRHPGGRTKTRTSKTTEVHVFVLEGLKLGQPQVKHFGLLG